MGEIDQHLIEIARLEDMEGGGGGEIDLSFNEEEIQKSSFQSISPIRNGGEENGLELNEEELENEIFEISQILKSKK